MKNDPLRQFITLRESLLKEKAGHLARLAQIDRALGPSGPTLSAAAVPAPAAAKADSKAPRKARRKGGRRKSGARKPGQPGLRETIRQLVTAKPLTKAEIVEGLRKAGRSFTKGYLGVVLYSKGNFKRVNGRFATPA